MEHENVHIGQLKDKTHPVGACCAKAQEAYKNAATDEEREKIEDDYIDWVEHATNYALAEIPALRVSMRCGKKLWRVKNCDKLPCEMEPPEMGDDNLVFAEYVEWLCCQDIRSFIRISSRTWREYWSTTYRKDYSECDL